MSDNGTSLADRLGAMTQAVKRIDDEEDDDALCFGCVRGNRKAFNIELRRLQGSWPAYEYAWLYYVEWAPAKLTLAPNVPVPAGSIVLHYQTGLRVVIAGRNLREVHKKLLDHRVTYFAEAEKSVEQMSDDDTVIVQRIDIIEPADEPE